MPKMKTHSGAKKRFKKSAGGKWLHERSGQRHLLAGTPSAQGRFMRKKEKLNRTFSKIMDRFQPYA